MPISLFVYGTLTFPEVVQALTGKTFKSKKATLDHYFIARLPDRPYPGLIFMSGKQAKGCVLFDVDDASFEIIKSWEDENYRLESVQISVNGSQMPVHVFIWNQPVKQPEAWDRDYFGANYLKDYVNNRIPSFLSQIN